MTRTMKTFFFITEAFLVALLLAFLLTGCSQLSTPDGDPLTPPGAVCVNTEQGRVCYAPTPQPAPVIPPAATLEK